MIKAVIFDMDGVISDTQRLHSRVESELLGRCGVLLTPEEITKRFAGVRTAEFFKTLLDERGAVYDLAELMHEKWEMMTQLAAQRVDSIPGSLRLVDDLRRHDFKLAVASASSLEYVCAVLKSLGIIDAFGAVVTGDDVKKGKPDPESFLLAAQKISVAPDQCLVIEDGVSGMVAAKSGGMKCIGLVADASGQYPADVIVKSLEEVTIDFIKNMVPAEADGGR